MQIKDEDILEFSEACTNSKTIEILVNQCSILFVNMGFSWMGFRYVPDAGSFEYNIIKIIPGPDQYRDFAKEDLEKHSYHNDPFEIYVLKSGSAEWTGDLVERGDFQSKDQRAFSKITTEHSGHSLIIPIFGPRRSRGYFYMPNKNLDQKPNIRDMAYMEYMCTRFYRRYSALREKMSTFLSLTPRELEVLQFIPLGLSNSEIGDMLEISPHTVTGHVSQIFVKLDVSSRLGASQRASTLDLIN